MNRQGRITLASYEEMLGEDIREALNKAEKSKANRQKERKKPSKELYGWRYPRISHTSQLKGRKSPKWVGVSRPR